MGESGWDTGMNPIHHFAAGVYARQMRLPARHQVQTHAHVYDHLSIMCGGPVAVECDGDVQRYEGVACILIKAGVKHTITALGDSEWFCIHATDETENMDEVLTVKE